MAKAAAFVLTPKSQLAFLQYYRESLLTVQTVRSAQRIKFAEIDRAYQRETNTEQEHLDAKNANRTGDKSRYQDVTVPVVMPQVEAAVVYQASVFLTGQPIFGVVSNPQFIDEALQMETVLENNAIRGGWNKQLMMFFRDGAKYNYAPVEVDWKREVTVEITTDAGFSTTEGKPVQTIWTGNGLTRLDPYNTFVDPRVPPSEVYKDGEFAGHTDFMSRIALKQFIAELSDTLTMNVAKAFESGLNTNPGYNSSETAEAYFVPDINPRVNAADSYEGNMNWLSWAEIAPTETGKNKAIQYNNSYEKTTLYCKILPSEFGLKVPGANTPQIWKLIIINHQVIIHAERQTNAHGYIPILIGMPNEDGLDYQTKSLADNAEPFQDVTTAFMSSIMASRRRAISDRVLYDPSRVTSAAINSPNPSAKIPIRPAAYGKPLSEAVYPFPYREDQGAFSVQQIRDLLGMANSLNGQNPARQGQFVKGNKTRSEFEEVMSNSNGRDQLVSILTESQVFVPMKHIFKLDILQFQGGTSLYSREKEQEVEIDPVALRKAVVEFKISDGLIPSDKIINADTLKTSIQVIGSSPQLNASYNLGPMFSYLMKTQGAEIRHFEKPPEQVAYEQAMNQWKELAMMLIEKGGDPAKTMPPQPLPEQYGYQPATSNDSPAAVQDGNQLPSPSNKPPTAG